jgi:hypothetical protein
MAKDLRSTLIANYQMTTANTKWKLEGDYFEGCNCDSICPCIFKGDPDEGFCNLTAAWHIQKGSYNETINLDGLNVSAIFHAPGNMQTGPKWDVALYIDERATKEQIDSLTTIYSGQAGGPPAVASKLIGKVLGVKSVPIEFNIDGKRRSLRIKDLLQLQIEGTAGGDPNQESLVVNPAFGLVPGPLVVSSSSKYAYNDHGMRWDNSGKNGFYCRFSYSS